MEVVTKSNVATLIKIEVKYFACMLLYRVKAKLPADFSAGDVFVKIEF